MAVFTLDYFKTEVYILEPVPVAGRLGITWVLKRQGLLKMLHNILVMLL